MSCLFLLLKQMDSPWLIPRSWKLHSSPGALVAPSPLVQRLRQEYTTVIVDKASGDVQCGRLDAWPSDHHAPGHRAGGILCSPASPTGRDSGLQVIPEDRLGKLQFLVVVVMKTFRLEKQSQEYSFSR